jgi:hypothetical protein
MDSNEISGEWNRHSPVESKSQAKIIGQSVVEIGFVIWI